MSNTQPVPCTRVKGKYWAPLLHFSTAITAGVSLCGIRGVVDQYALNRLPGARVRLYTLRRCERCDASLAVSNLTAVAERALAALIA